MNEKTGPSWFGGRYMPLTLSMALSDIQHSTTYCGSQCMPAKGWVPKLISKSHNSSWEIDHSILPSVTKDILSSLEGYKVLI